MNRKVYRAATAVLVLLSFSAANDSAKSQTLTIASYNIEDNPMNAGADANLSAIVGSIATNIAPLDLLAFQEGSGTLANIQDLNQSFGTNYAVDWSAPDPFSPPGNDRTGFVYNTNTLSISNVATLTAGVHNIRRARFTPFGGSSADSFYAYSIHLKAGTSSADATTRVNDVAAINADVATLPTGSNVLFLGDFNLQGNNETAYANLNANDTLNAGVDTAGNIYGPENNVTWNDNLAYQPVHTQNPAGPMDDRFDLQLVSDELFDGVGLEYKRNSLQTFGNTGAHSMNGSLDGGAPVRSELVAFSDHLPVVAQYTYGSDTVPFNKDRSVCLDDSAVMSTRVGTSGANSSAFFNVLGSGQGASYGVLDVDLSNVLNPGEMASAVENIHLELIQSIFGSSANGPMSIYLADANATLPNYVSGNDELDVLPDGTLKSSAIGNLLTTYGFNNKGTDDVDKISLDGSAALEASLINALNSAGKMRFLLVPDESGTGASYGGFTNTTLSRRPQFKFDLDVTAVPEPSAAISLLLVAAAVGACRRARQSLKRS